MVDFNMTSNNNNCDLYIEEEGEEEEEEEEEEEDEYTDEDDDFIIIENLKDIQVILDKEFQDLTIEDMRRFIFKTFDMNFIKKYAKIQGFGVRRMGYAKVEKMDIQLRSPLYDVRLTKHVENTDRVRKAKDEICFGCKVEIWFKWIRETNHWIVTRFVVEHIHPLANADQVLYLRLDNVSF
ncbi:hypothetical protein Cgig2_012973 [Carnegiea gigantea]|uniref:FAR1 domain-containing protein n=1 Tax=Carnegiea gigantea TaxID=171969 RepID=A0A9Q1K1I5_9CARY|nr:hypothetical protein Cgig2_012973 [Carnegiea gigantea]